MKRIYYIILALWASVMLGWVGYAPISVAQADDSLRGKLALTIAPPVLPSDGLSHPVVYVQLLASDGSPILAVENTKISLISSDARIGNIPQTVEIPAGRSFAVASITTTATPGKITLTAVSHEWEMGTAEVTTFDTLMAARPFRLTLHASPPKMIVGSAPPGLLSVVLQGANGVPVLTDRDLVVEIEVSAPDVVGIAPTATIPANSYFTTIEIDPSSTGTAVLTAVSAGFVSEFMVVHVVEPAEIATSLAVYVSPPVLRSGVHERPSIIIQALDDDETPVIFPCREIKISSSYPYSANASSSLAISCDTARQFAEAGLEVGTVPGTPTIVVAGTGLTPASTGVTVHGQTPAKLKLYTAPRAPLAIDSTPGYLVIQVVDNNDVPVTLHRGIQVSFQGADVVPAGRAFIPSGSSFTRVRLVKPETSVPKALIWGVGKDLASAQASVEIFSVNLTVLIDETERPAFVNQPRLVELQVKSNDVPVSRAMLTWSADVGLLIESDPYSDENGKARATYIGDGVGDVKISVRAVKSGFSIAEAEVEISVVQAPPSTSDQPLLLGVPVRVLFALALVSLVGYAAVRLRQALGGRIRKLLRRDSGEVGT